MEKRPTDKLPWASISNGCGLEEELQRHLDLAGAADGVGDEAEAEGAVVEAGVGLDAAGVAAGGEGGFAGCSEGVEVLVLVDVVAGDVEAGGVGYVLDIEGVFEGVALSEVGDLDE